MTPGLDASLEFQGRSPGDGYGGELLVTGSASLLGGYLLAELLEHTTATVHAPVADADFAAGYDAIRGRLMDCGQWEPGYGRRIRPVPADLTKPWLGLSPASFADLAARLDAIYHCAADDHLRRSYNELAPVNVHGTHELLRLAAFGRGVRFHQVSIITVAPVDEAGNRCVEAWPDGWNRVFGAAGADGFIRTRWEAEQLVATASHRGLAASIYRTTTLTGGSDGCYPVRDVLVEYIDGTARAGVCPPGPAGWWTPADYAARAVALLASEPPGVYHVPGCAVPMHWVWEHVRGWGRSLRGGSDDEWRAAVRAVSAPLAILLDDFPDSSARRPEPDCSRALAAIAGRLGPPVITVSLVGRYLDNLRARGLLSVLPAERPGWPDRGRVTRSGVMTAPPPTGNAD